MGLRNQPGGSLDPVSDALRRAVATPGASGRTATRADVADTFDAQADPPAPSAGIHLGAATAPGTPAATPTIDLSGITAAITELRAAVAAAADTAAGAETRAAAAGVAAGTAQGAADTAQAAAAGVAARLSYMHVQTVPATVWTVTHDLGYPPSGQLVIDSDGDALIGFGVQILDPARSLRLTFDVAFAGTAYLS